MSVITGDPEEQSFFIKGPAGKLEAKAVGVQSALLVGIICHPHPLYQGSMDNKVVTTILRAWRELGIATVRFNFRGVGKSEGHYGEGKGEVEDLQAVMHWVQSQNVKTEQINQTVKLWLGGFSFGSAIATIVAGQAASQSIVSALLTVAPPVNHFDFEKINVPRCPWLLISGNNDEVVPHDKVISFVDEVKKKKKNLEFIEMENSTHFFHGQLIELKSQIINSMRSWI